MDWAAFLRAHNLEHSMSRRGNRHDNAVAESFFNLLKRERIRRRTYRTCEDARQDVFDYIEMFYNPKRKHVRNGMVSPAELERRQMMRCKGVHETRGYSAEAMVRTLLPPLLARADVGHNRSGTLVAGVGFEPTTFRL